MRFPEPFIDIFLNVRFELSLTDKRVKEKRHVAEGWNGSEL